MARNDPQIVITQSLIDRLRAKEPDKDLSVARNAFQHFKDSVRRDLEMLLNARVTPEPAPDHFTEVQKSIYHFGMPDITLLNLRNDVDRAEIVRRMERAIEIFEPRLENVHVEIENANGTSGKLRFRIEALIRIDPAPEVVSFDTDLKVSSGEYEVR